MSHQANPTNHAAAPGAHHANLPNHAAAPGAHHANLPNHADVNMEETRVATVETNPIHHAPGLNFEFWRNILHRENVAEAVVNGFWFQVLQHYFPAPGFMICPEKRFEAKSGKFYRADLVVQQVKFVEGVNGEPGRYARRPVFVFEGKRGGLSPAEFDNCLPQLAGYIGQCAPLHSHTYGMLASGPNFIIMASTVGGNPADIHMVRYSNEQAVVNVGPERVRLDVTNREQMAKVDGILRYLRKEAEKITQGYNAKWSDVEWNA